MRARLLPSLVLFAAALVPLSGWFFGDWSGASTLVVYWVETMLICLFAWARIRLHQRRAPRYGHFRYVPPESPAGAQTGSFATGFLTRAVAFSIGHGVFLVAALLVLARSGHPDIAEVDWRDVGIGCLSIAALLAIDFLVELPTLRRWSFRQVELSAQRGLSRMAVVHLTLILGLAAIALTDIPDAIFGVFVILKTLAALGGAFPQWESTAPPRRLARLMNRLPGAGPGIRFEDAWAADQGREQDRRERNEEPWAIAGEQPRRISAPERRDTDRRTR